MVKEFIKKLLSCLFIILAVFVVTVVTVNLPVFDEAPLPEVVRLMEPVALPPAEQNAAVAMLGFSAAPDRDMVVVGQKVLEQLDKYTPYKRLMGALDDDDEIRILGSTDLDVSWGYKFASCAQEAENCLLKYSEKLSNLEDTVPLEKLIARFQILKGMPEYIVPSDKLLFPQYSLLLNVNRLHIAKTYTEDGAEAAIAVLDSYLGFWRRQLTEPDFLIGRMIAIAAVRINLNLLSNLIELEELGAENQRRIAKLLQPLTLDELDMTAIYLYEQRFVMQYWDAAMDILTEEAFLPGEATWWNSALRFLDMHFLTQKNATFNTNYKYFIQPLGCLSRQPWQGYKAYLESGSNKTCNIVVGEPKWPWWSGLYNPGGKYIDQWETAMPLPAYSDYIARGHDVNGIIALLRLQLAFRAGELETIDKVLADTEAKKYLPNPVEYNPETGILSFDCLQEGNSHQCSVRLVSK